VSNTLQVTETWPPDYKTEIQRRLDLRHWLDTDKEAEQILRAVYAAKGGPLRFIQDWGITFDPRISGGSGAMIPMIPFKKQQEFICWVEDCVRNQTQGVNEKTRDMGATWCCTGVSVCFFLFTDFSIKWGSRVASLVDDLGVKDTVFEKVRMQLKHTPPKLLPKGFIYGPRSPHMKENAILNPSTGAEIIGEGGDNIGRGGRSTAYFIDEAAHLERAEKIEAALSENTECRIYISSVNGPGNMFAKKARAIGANKFILDWKDHPGKTQAWYDKKRDKAESEGLLHIFAQEIDRDYGASVEGTLIPGAWVKASIDAHIALGIEPSGIKQTGLDICDGGSDINAKAIRHGILLHDLEGWGDDNQIYTTEKAVCSSLINGVSTLIYDATGVGATIGNIAEKIGVDDKDQRKRVEAGRFEGQTELEKMFETHYPEFDGEIPEINLEVHAHQGGASPDDPDEEYSKGRINKDMFLNLKAQRWWLLADRFRHTYNAVVRKQKFDPENIISISSTIQHREKLEAELSQPVRKKTAAGKIIIDKAPKGTKSPNYADSVVLCFANQQVSEFHLEVF